MNSDLNWADTERMELGGYDLIANGRKILKLPYNASLGDVIFRMSDPNTFGTDKMGREFLVKLTEQVDGHLDGLKDIGDGFVTLGTSARDGGRILARAHDVSEEEGADLHSAIVRGTAPGVNARDVSGPDVTPLTPGPDRGGDGGAGDVGGGTGGRR